MESEKGAKKNSFKNQKMFLCIIILRYDYFKKAKLNGNFDYFLL